VATFPQLPAGLYTVTVESPNFQQSIFQQVKIEVGKDYPLVAQLQAGQVSESVTVTAGESLVQTTNAELTTTVTPRQVRDLPLDGRDPLQLIQLQAGVSPPNGRANVTIDAQRESSAIVTQDGITIQDFAIRTGALEFSPNRTTVAQVSEFSVTSQNGGADQQGSSQVRLITPSGTNELHGEIFEYHRNDALGANDFFNNRTISSARSSFAISSASPSAGPCSCQRCTTARTSSSSSARTKASASAPPSPRPSPSSRPRRAWDSSGTAT